MKTTITRYRKARGMTLRELAERVGKSYSRLSEYESGHNIPLATLYVIAQVLDIPTGDLFLHDDDTPVTPGKPMATRLRTTREALGLTMTEVAARAQMDLSKLSRLETRQMKLTVDDVLTLAYAMGCTPSDLIPDMGDGQRVAQDLVYASLHER